MSVVAIIPALNEERTIATVVQRLLGVVAQVIVVDDGSRDATAAHATQAGAHVVKQARNQGYDAALNAGFAEALRRGATVLVSCDADGQHRVEDVAAVVAPVQAGTADLAVGERAAVTHPAERLFALYTRGRFGVRDPLCGLKAYQRRVVEAVGHFDTERSIGTQLMVEACLAGFKLVRVPIQVQPRHDTSRFYARALRANLRILGAMQRMMRIDVRARL